jgi:WD40 repeat protein
MTFSPDGNYLAAVVLDREDFNGTGSAHEIVLYNLSYPEAPVSRVTYEGWPEGSFFSASGKSLILSGSAPLTVLSVPDLNKVKSVPSISETEVVALHPSGNFVASYSRDNTLRVYRMPEGTEVAQRRLERSSFGKSSLVFVDKGRTLVASATAANQIVVWRWSEQDIVDSLCARLSDELIQLANSSSDFGLEVGHICENEKTSVPLNSDKRAGSGIFTPG